MAFHIFKNRKEVPPTGSSLSREKAQVNPNIEEPPVINEYEDAERNYDLRSPKFWSIVVGMYIVIFLVALVVLPAHVTPEIRLTWPQDRSIVAAAIPTITDEFNSLSDVAWYGSAYSLACACFNPISGRVYQLYRTKRVFLLSMLVFEVGSTLCGAAPTSAALIAGRAVAGAASAFITSGCIMILQPYVPIRKRPVFVSIFGLSFGVASVAGPIVGGALTEHATWRWCFYLNLPIAGVAAIVVLLLFRSAPVTPQEKTTLLAQLQQLDVVGICFFMPSMVSLMLALQWGGSKWPWASPRIIGLLVAFGLLLVMFIIAEWMTPETAMVPKRVVLNRSVAGSMLYMFLASGGVMSIIYYLTYWFQAIQNVSATQAGIRTLPIIIPFVLVGIVAATLTQKIRTYIPAMLFAPFACATGAGLLSILTPGSNTGEWIGYQVLFGIGIGMGYQNAQLPPQNALPRIDVPLGMALIYFVQQLGGSICLTISQNILSSILVQELSGVDGLEVPKIINSGALELLDAVPTDKHEIVVSAYNHALTRIFLFAAATTASMIIGAFLIEWVKLQDGPPSTATKAAEREEITDEDMHSSKRLDHASAAALPADRR